MKSNGLLASFVLMAAKGKRVNNKKVYYKSKCLKKTFNFLKGVNFIVGGDIILLSKFFLNDVSLFGLKTLDNFIMFWLGLCCNSYLSHRIIGSFPRIYEKIKN